ncbi:MAG: GNAT family N-acetyltransferase [Chloroflexia bacterium]
MDKPLPDGCTLRPARAADEAAIRKLVRAAQLDPTQMRWPQFRVVECGGRVVACGQLRRFAGAQELGSLVVLPSRRGQNLGARLVEQLIAEASGPLYLECQGALVPFYAGFGFREVSWRTPPGLLKLKFGVSKLLSRIFRQRVASMKYIGAPPVEAS